MQKDGDERGFPVGVEPQRDASTKPWSQSDVTRAFGPHEAALMSKAIIREEEEEELMAASMTFSVWLKF